ncbi:acyl-CoA thioesterase [Nocardia pseudovaccinii]|uniref:acyl-CoA thioesterase n=1 Tax=Nocardia pseudovaccinii TaxID=189540 RepID=UPI0007A3EF03|nr:acyl-CoA thioesterase [Nocardia pseudovaccinii]
MGFALSITVSPEDIDRNGHMNQAVYLQYAERARWACLREGGLSQEKLQDAGVGPISLQVTLEFKQELFVGDEVTVTCDFAWDGKTHRTIQEIRKADGTVSAEIVGVGGLLDLTERRLVPDAARYFRDLAQDPTVFGLGRSA